MERTPHFNIALSVSLIFFILTVSYVQASNPSSSSNSKVQRRQSFFNRKLTEAQKRLLSPLPEDEIKFAGFLRQENTGIFRLLPKGKYEFSTIISAERDPDTVLPIRGGGAYYSFTEETHRYGPWSEIGLQEGYLMVGFTREALGLLTVLGDVPIESVNANSPGVEYLDKFKPPTTFWDALAYRNQSLKGYDEEGFEYYSLYPGVPNTTYVVRSIAYKKEGQLVWSPGLSSSVYIPHPHEYMGADILVAIRIVRLHEDGSLTILYKKLQKYRAQKLKATSRRPDIEEVETLLKSETPIGSDISDVLSFLNFRGISHSAYDDTKDDSSSKKRVIEASLPSVRGKRNSWVNLRISFFFDEEKKLTDYKLEKNAR